MGIDPKRNIRGIPDGAWAGKSFEIDHDNSERAEAVNLETPKYWAFRLRERLKDPSRVWTTEVGIAERKADEVAFGCRLICSQRGIGEPIARSIPNFVRGIAFTQKAFLDGRPTSPDPWLVASEQDVADFIVFLEAPTRHHPVVAFSLPEGSENADETAIPVHQFIQRTVGFVHPVVVTSQAAFALTDHVGRGGSVYRQAVRTYNPGFGSDTDLPTDHPFAAASRIAEWDTANAQTFSDFLVNQCLRVTQPRDVLEHEQPPFQRIKRLAAQQRREAALQADQDHDALIRLLEDELTAAKQEVEDSLQMASNAETEQTNAESELEQMKASYLALQERLGILSSRQKIQESNNIHDNLNEIQDWSERNLSGQVELHSRAIKTITKSDFQDVALIYNALLAMRDFYVPMKLIGGIDKKNSFDQRLAELGLDKRPCFNQKNKAKKYGGEYYIQYHGKDHELNWHLKGSNNRDGRLGFRMYYFWDAGTSRVVVGYLPGHLRTDIT